MECEVYTGPHRANVSAMVCYGNRGRVCCGCRRNEGREVEIVKIPDTLFQNVH
jgi:hypothetical protein